MWGDDTRNTSLSLMMEENDHSSNMMMVNKSPSNSRRRLGGGIGSQSSFSGGSTNVALAFTNGTRQMFSAEPARMDSGGRHRREQLLNSVQKSAFSRSERMKSSHLSESESDEEEDEEDDDDEGHEGEWRESYLSSHFAEESIGSDLSDLSEWDEDHVGSSAASVELLEDEDVLPEREKRQPLPIPNTNNRSSQAASMRKPHQASSSVTVTASEHNNNNSNSRRLHPSPAPPSSAGGSSSHHQQQPPSSQVNSSGSGNVRKNRPQSPLSPSRLQRRQDESRPSYATSDRPTSKANTPRSASAKSTPNHHQQQQQPQKELTPRFAPLPPPPSTPISSLTSKPPSVSIPTPQSTHKRSSTSTAASTSMSMTDGWRVTAVEKGDRIGRGSFGNVYKGKDLITGRPIAIKEIVLPKDFTKDYEKQLMFMEREVRVMRKVQHPNTVLYLGANREDNALQIYMEFLGGGTIRERLRQKWFFSDALARFYTTQLLDGLGYLQKHKIIHRDLKGDNLFLAGDFPVSSPLYAQYVELLQSDPDLESHAVVKVGDFGTSKELISTLTTDSVAGTPNFMAPEVISCIGHSYQADIWSVGCCVLEMLTGMPPFAKLDNHMAVMFAVMKGKFLDQLPPPGESGALVVPKHILANAELHQSDAPPPPSCFPPISDAARDFMGKCTAVKAAERWTVEQLKQHYWITGGDGPRSPISPAASAGVSAASSPMSTNLAGASVGSGSRRGGSPKAENSSGHVSPWKGSQTGADVSGRQPQPPPHHAGSSSLGASTSSAGILAPSPKFSASLVKKRNASLTRLDEEGVDGEPGNH